MGRGSKTYERYRYKFSERILVKERWRALMPNVCLQDMHDGLMSVVNGYLTIDLLKLGGELEKLYPVEWEHLSMMEIIETHYGTAAVSLIESLT